MPRRHRDNSNRLNLERNLGVSSRYAPNDDYSLWKRDMERQGQGRGNRPFVDRELEKDADKAARAHVRGVHYGKGPKGFRRSDERIKEDVCQALFDSYDVDASNIEVEVKDACVYLKGEVDDRMTKRMAEDTVENLKGLKMFRTCLLLSVNQKLKETSPGLKMN